MLFFLMKSHTVLPTIVLLLSVHRGFRILQLLILQFYIGSQRTRVKLIYSISCLSGTRGSDKFI
ncbi:hypothetical protein MAR_030344 [Mya arenaria]|uniref:Uncharacterized protein n=1 Tax=Mya arenaria TaxID=6604 RepID=A0ABY7DM99_MYAAR|nr:hypothetical protein MAR_030344 [Mya arenaria]